MARRDRVSMNRHAQILEMHRQGHSNRRIAQALKMCKKSVRKYIDKSLHTHQRELSEAFPTPQTSQSEEDPDSVIVQFPNWLQELDWTRLVEERQKGVSFKVLYQEIDNKEVKYWTFWSTLRRLCGVLHPEIPKTTMRLNHKPGEKAFVDYGDGIDIVDLETGEVRRTWIFVGTLPFSSKVFAEFVFDQKLASFIASHEKMWKYFGGVARYAVCDNLKSAVVKAHLYDPDLNKTYCDYANQAGFAVLPARPKKPKDKANVECHVGILQRSFFQEVRNKTFHSIAELNIDLLRFLERLNNEIMKDHGVSRNQRFEVEAPLLGRIPDHSFVIPIVRDATVHPDCHIQVGKSFYSVPWQYVGRVVRAVMTADRLEVYDLMSLERIALHTSAKRDGERKTEPLHWPPEKREQCDFSITRACEESKKIGPKTQELFLYLFNLPHPLQYLRRTQGWLRRVSGARCSRESMEYAATMALQHNKYGTTYINDCANFFEAGGLLKLKNKQVSAPPKRELGTMFLSKTTEFNEVANQ